MKGSNFELVNSSYSTCTLAILHFYLCLCEVISLQILFFYWNYQMNYCSTCFYLKCVFLKGAILVHEECSFVRVQFWFRILFLFLFVCTAFIFLYCLRNCCYSSYHYIYMVFLVMPICSKFTLSLHTDTAYVLLSCWLRSICMRFMD